MARWRGLIWSVGLDILEWDWQRGGVGGDVQSPTSIDSGGSVLDRFFFDWQRGGVGDDVQFMVLVDAGGLFFGWGLYWSLLSGS
jgi:hypothetical protein